MNTARANASKWIHSAFAAVNRAFPAVNWQAESEEIQKAQDALDWALFSYFYSDISGAPTGTLDGVRVAWRNYYRKHL